MATRDISSNLGPVSSVGADGNRTADVTGSSVDLRGFDSAMVVVDYADITDGGFTAKVQESDDDSTFTDVAAADLVGSFSEYTTGTDTQKVSYAGDARYIRVFVEETTAGTTGAKFSSVVIRGHAHQRPVA